MDAIAKINRDLSVSHGDDQGLFVVFERKAVQNKVKSEAAGRPIFDEFDYIEITIPGGKTKVVEKVTDHHKQRFPKHWELHQKMLDGKTGASLIGTPLDQWPAMSVSQVHEMRALGIHTVDQLAHLNENGISAIGRGGRELKAKAAAFIAQASGDAEAEALAAENIRQADEITDLRNQIAQLAEQMRQMQNAKSNPASVEQPAYVAADEGLQHPQVPAPTFQPGTLSDPHEIAIPARRGRPPKQG
jgi:hypothetical protein